MYRYVFMLCICIFFSITTVFAQDTVEMIVRENAQSSTNALVNIRTNISGVEVYFNNLYKGIAPLTIDEMTPGIYSVLLKKDGWEKKSVYVSLEENTETNLYFELVPITGFLRIDTNIDNAEVYIDGVKIEATETLSSHFLEIQEGVYTVKVTKFGYETQSKTVRVFEHVISNADFTMEKALFDIESFSARSERFNPLAPGGLSIASFDFVVNAPSSALFEVVDKNNVVVYSQHIVNINSANNRVKWNGKNSLGIPLLQGAYTAKLTAIPNAGWTSKVLSYESEDSDNNTIVTTTRTIIDNSIFYPLVSASALGSSNGTVNARLMPVGTTLVSFSGVSDFSTTTGFTSLPFSLSGVFTPFSFTELSLRIGAEAQSNSSTNIPVFFGTAIKLSTSFNDFYFAGTVRYTYSTEKSFSPIYTDAGLGLGLAFAYEINSILLTASEEAVFGSETGNVGAFDGHLKTGLSIQFQKGSFSSNAWASLYSPFSLSSMVFFDTIETGIEAMVLLPNTTIVPTLGCSYAYSDSNSHTIGVRFGMQVLIP